LPEPADNQPDEEALDGELVAEVRHLPVPADQQRSEEIEVRRPVSVPATVAAATGGFVLGVAAFVLIKVLRRPSSGRALAQRRARKLAKARGVDIASSRSFLVDVHLLNKR
jgi:hypothetical protein